jgi:hypothetical protein
MLAHGGKRLASRAPDIGVFILQQLSVMWEEIPPVCSALVVHEESNKGKHWLKSIATSATDAADLEAANAGRRCMNEAA